MSSQSEPLPPAHATPLLRNRMLRNVLVPLVLTWFCASAAMLVVANDFAGKAFDRTLQDNAHAIASRLSLQEDNHVGLDISEAQLNAALYEQATTVYFSILTAQGARLAGATLPEMKLPSILQNSIFEQIDLSGTELRAVVMRHTMGPEDYFIVVAHTTEARKSLIRKLLFSSSLPILLLLFPLTIWLWDRIEHDLLPLANLHDALARRDAKDLRPLEVTAPNKEVEQVSKAVNALMGRLARSIRTQKEFAGNVAHELRTPLAGIRALAEYALADRTADGQQEALRQIVNSTERASRMVNQLLDLAMLDEEKPNLRIETINLINTIHEAVLRHLDKADQLGIDLGARGLDERESAGCFISTDPDLLNGLLDNLIDNALRYGGKTVTLVLSDEPKPGWCALAVEDDGPGIEPHIRKSMMQRWTQGSDGAQLGQGAGLGLFLVARYSQLLGTKLELGASKGGKGLRASVSLQTKAKAPETTTEKKPSL